MSEEEKDQKGQGCQNPMLESIRKPCGCLSVTTCLTCGRVDRYPEDHHRLLCPQYHGTTREVRHIDHAATGEADKARQALREKNNRRNRDRRARLAREKRERREEKAA